MSAAPILSRSVDVATIGAGGVERRFTASAAERDALAKAYGLREVRAFAADLTATPKAGAIVVEGRVTADIVQSCVVTLEPVEQVIDEPVEIRFARADADTLPPKPGAEIRIDLDAADPPDPLLGPSIDLGAVAEEYFALAIDPYPRAPGAELPAGLGGAAEDRSDSPFAALAALRPKSGGGR